MTFHGMRSTMNGAMSSSQEKTMRGWANMHSPPMAMNPRIHGHTSVRVCACFIAGAISDTVSGAVSGAAAGAAACTPCLVLSSAAAPALCRRQRSVRASHKRNVIYSQYGRSEVASP